MRLNDLVLFSARGRRPFSLYPTLRRRRRPVGIGIRVNRSTRQNRTGCRRERLETASCCGRQTREQ